MQLFIVLNIEINNISMAANWRYNNSYLKKYKKASNILDSMTKTIRKIKLVVILEVSFPDTRTPIKTTYFWRLVGGHLNLPWFWLFRAKLKALTGSKKYILTMKTSTIIQNLISKQILTPIVTRVTIFFLTFPKFARGWSGRGNERGFVENQVT